MTSKLDLTASIRAAYNQATLRHLAKQSQGNPNWTAIKDIQTKHETARQQEVKSYRQNYDHRLQDARAQLMKQRGRLELEPKGPGPVDRHNPQTLERKAHRLVRLSHRQNLDSLNRAEAKVLKKLTKGQAKPQTRSQSKPTQKALSKGAPSLKTAFKQRH